jgi:AmmeMemoRadiSam system protein A
MDTKPAHDNLRDESAPPPASQDGAAVVPADAQEAASALPALARRAVETFTLEGRVQMPPAALTSLLAQPSACFVSIKTDRRELRGCIGTTSPSMDTLAEEIVANALSAATRDPRFTPVTADELPHLIYSVDVLDRPEPCRFEELDPQTFGVIVEDNIGSRRGLLLPAIEGVETAEQQVRIAARKAGIEPSAPLRLYRFRVRRFSESAQTVEA